MLKTEFMEAHAAWILSKNPKGVAFVPSSFSDYQQWAKLASGSLELQSTNQSRQQNTSQHKTGSNTNRRPKKKDVTSDQFVWIDTY